MTDIDPEIFEGFVTLREREGICAPMTHRFSPGNLTEGQKVTCQCGDLTVTLRAGHLAVTAKAAALPGYSFAPGSLSIKEI